MLKVYARYDEIRENWKMLKEDFPDLEIEYMRVETKAKITHIGFGVDDIKVRDWNKPID